jgi:hypothetical protein
MVSQQHGSAAMAMKLIETIVSETSVRMRYADDADPAKAIEWVDFQVSLSELLSPNGQAKLGDPESRFLAEIRLAALRYVRDAIGGETQRLSSLASRTA